MKFVSLQIKITALLLFALIAITGCTTLRPVNDRLTAEEEELSNQRANDRLLMLEQAAQTQPGDLSAQLAYAKALHFKATRTDGPLSAAAVANLENLHARFPQSARVLAYLGSSQLNCARFDTSWMRRLSLCKKGLANLDRALELSPLDVEVHFIRGVSLFYLPSLFNRGADARADLLFVEHCAEEAVKTNQLEAGLAASALYHCGLLRERQHDQNGALDAWRRAVILSRDSRAGILSIHQLEMHDEDVPE